MKIELEHGTTLTVLTIITDTDDPDQPVQPDYEDTDLVITLLQELKGAYGFYGHILDPGDTTNLDLYSACLDLPSFSLLRATPVPSPRALPEGVTS